MHGDAPHEHLRACPNSLRRGAANWEKLKVHYDVALPEAAAAGHLNSYLYSCPYRHLVHLFSFLAESTEDREGLGTALLVEVRRHFQLEDALVCLTLEG